MGKARIFVLALLVFLLLLAEQFPVLAEYNNLYYPFIKNFERSDYKAGNQTWMISQAQNGLIYFANNNGLVEFDGHNWELYGLYNYTIIRSVYAAPDGKIYVGLSNNFGFFDTDSTGRLSFKSLLGLLPPGTEDVDDIWKIHNTSEGVVFQSFNKLFVLKGKKLEVINAPNKFHYSFYINNKLYIVDVKEGIMEFKNGRFIILAGANSLTKPEICAILPYGKALMVCTTDNGVFIYNNNKIEKWHAPANELLLKSQIYCAQRIGENLIAFGTIQSGLLLTDNNGVPQLAMDKTKGLQNNTILSMLLDRSGNLWLGTDNGIDQLYLNSPVRQLSLNREIGSGYTAVIHNNGLYLGTNQGVFYKEWKGSGNLKQGSGGFRLIESTKGQVWGLQVIDGELFCGHNKGTFIIQGSSAQKIADIAGVWMFLHSDKHPDRIIAGTYTGLVLFRKISGKWRFSHAIEGFHESSRLMVFDADENIWMSHGFKGVYQLFLNENADSVDTVRFYDSKKGFRADFGINISLLQGQIVFCSSEGIFVYNAAHDSILPSAYFNKLFSNQKVNFAIEDFYGNIWYYYDFNLGLKWLKNDGMFVDITMPFRQLQGKFIEGFQFVYPIDKNNFLISYEEGFVHFNPELLRQQEALLNLYLSKVVVSGTDSVIFNGHLFGKNNHIPELSYSENSLQFFFSAVHFENPDKVEFSTFLEGHDKTWSKWERRYSREFTNLKEGGYSFQIKARDIHKNETNLLRYSFVVSPPWGRTKTAFFIYFLCLFAFIGLIVFLLIKRINYLKMREKKIQKQKFIEREKQLQQEALIAEKEIIRLKNERLMEKIKSKDMELANSTMQTIQKNKFLISLKKELVRHSNDITVDSAKRLNKLLVRKIDNEINNENNWKVFEEHFISVHEEFLTKIKQQYPNISPAELRLCACLRMNISSKEIASLLNISIRGVEASRYRLRKTLGIDRNTNLTDLILSI
ncbi:MAG: hypothetical protein JXB34_10700 [Bacteroidales bacterium]|nr:hypothetical protein [Bacteroidales bacterium]